MRSSAENLSDFPNDRKPASYNMKIRLRANRYLSGIVINMKFAKIRYIIRRAIKSALSRSAGCDFLISARKSVRQIGKQFHHVRRYSNFISTPRVFVLIYMTFVRLNHETVRLARILFWTNSSRMFFLFFSIIGKSIG